MSDAELNIRAEAFEEDLLFWTALHHFLPAPLLRELAVATVKRGLPGMHFDDLFDDVLSQGSDVLASWALAPRPAEGKDAAFYQQHIRSLAWSNDSEMWSQSGSDEAASLGDQIGDALRLGQMDFGARKLQLDRLRLPPDDRVNLLAAALGVCLGTVERGADEASSRVIAGLLQDLPRPLNAVAMKHFGDLYADADRWGLAGRFYSEAKSSLADPPHGWGAFCGALSDMAAQSEASAVWIVEGADAASRRLGDLAPNPPAADRLATLNGRHDHLVARLRSKAGRDWSDLRAAVMSPPLLTHSHDVSRALEMALNGKGTQAARHFWSTLRRHLALGSFSDVRATKAEYGRALAGGLANPSARIDPEGFSMGVRLLLESGLEEVAAHTRFSQATVRAFVSPALIDDLAKRARRYPGSEDERGQVLVELAALWVKNLGGEQSELAAHLLLEIVSWARDRPAAFDRSDNISGRCLKILIERAQEQPEFRPAVADAVHDAVLRGVADDSFWNGKVEALKLACLYVDLWSQAQIRVLLDRMPALLKPESAGGMVFVARAALEFIQTEEAMNVVRAAPELGGRFFADVLRYNLADRNDPITTLFSLSTFAGEAPLNHDDANSVAQILEDVRERAASLNSSGAVDAIRALFIASGQVGPEGVRFAAECLIKLLTRQPKGSSPSFAYAYDALLMLVRARSEIERSAGLSSKDFQGLLDDIGDALVQAWDAIIEKPMRLAPFSLPPAEAPSSVLINNWTVATVQFAKQVSNPAFLDAALVKAAEHPVLRETVHRVVVSGSSEVWHGGVADEMAQETDDVFYQLLGHRLAQARTAPEDDRSAAWDLLLSQVLSRGPNSMDLAVFAALPVDHPSLSNGREAYLLRLQARRDLQRLLAPMIPRDWGREGD